MRRIAIVDDRKECVESLDVVLKEYMTRSGEHIEIYSYSNPKTIIYELEDGQKYDLFLLDIEMPEMNGIELAKNIRTYCEYAYIIFITSHEAYAIKGYEVDAFRYIMKEEIEGELPEALDRIKEKWQRMGKTDYYIIENTIRCEKLLYRDIIKITKEAKNSVFYTRCGIFKERLAISKVMARLPKEQFVWVDQGTVANMACIVRVHSNTISLCNGETIFTSRSKINHVKKEVSAYWGREL